MHRRLIGLAAMLGLLASALACPKTVLAQPEKKSAPVRPVQFCPGEPPLRMPLADPCIEVEPCPEACPEPCPGPVLVPGTTTAPGAGAVAPGGLPVPAVNIRVRVPASAAAGQNLEYHILVENDSPAPAHHVLIRDPLPANARFVRAEPAPAARDPELLWRFGTLPAGEHREIVLVLAPTGKGDIDNCARVQFEHGQCVRTAITRPVLSVRKTGPTQAVLGDPLTYQLTVTNSGTTEATGVVLTDSLAAGLEHASGQKALSWEFGTLAPGQSRSIEYQVVARAAGRLCNRAVVSAAGGLREQAESCLTVNEAKIALTMTGPPRRYINLPASYHLTVKNAGTAPLANVQIVDALPPRTAFVSATGDGRLVGSEVQWSVGSLDPGNSRSVDVVLRPEGAGRICNRATATAERGVSARAEACTEFMGMSALLIQLVDTDDPVEVGAETSYIVTVVNQGSVPATNLLIVADVPPQMEVVRAKGPSDNRKEGRKLIFEPTTLQPRAEAKYVMNVKALRPGDVRFKVDMSADQLTGGLVHEEESTTIYTDLPAGGSRPPEGVPRSRRLQQR